MRRRRSPARWLAPLALVACAVAVYTVVNATLLSSDEPAATSSTGKTTTAKSGTVSQRSKSGKRRTTRRRRTYIVKSGDTLSSIALEHGTTARSLAFWNRTRYPSLDPDAASYDPNRIEIGWVLLFVPDIEIDEDDTFPEPTPTPAAEPSP